MTHPDEENREERPLKDQAADVALLISTHMINELRRLPRPYQADNNSFDGRYLRELMSREEKLFELHRIYDLPPALFETQCLRILKKLDDSDTLTFYRCRNSVRRVWLNNKCLCVNKQRGRELTLELQYLVRTRKLEHLSIIASIEQLTPGSLPTLEEKTFEQVRLNTPDIDIDTVQDEIYTLIAARLIQKGRIPPLALSAIRGRHSRVRKTILKIIRNSQTSRKSS